MLLQMELCKELMVAAKTGDENELKRNIEEGVDVNYQNEVLIWKDKSHIKNINLLTRSVNDALEMCLTNPQQNSVLHLS